MLLDLVMPAVDGFEVLQTIKRDSRLWDLPVIMISSVKDTASIVRCIATGAADFVSKPFDPVILQAKISGCLARKRFHDLEVEHQSDPEGAGGPSRGAQPRSRPAGRTVENRLQRIYEKLAVSEGDVSGRACRAPQEEQNRAAA